MSGANRGLGLGTAEHLAEQGYTVWMLGRDKSKIEEAAASLSSSGLSVKPFQCDVTNDVQVQVLAKALLADAGKVDVLINNAGVFIDRSSADAADYGSIFSVKPDVLIESFETNTIGPLRLTQALAPLLRESEGARVVNVSSGMGQLSDMNGGAPGYRLSKTALNAVTRILASEFQGTPVKVNSVCPGWVKTDMGGAGANRSIPEGVKSIVWAAFIPADGPTGGFFRDGKSLDW